MQDILWIHIFLLNNLFNRYLLGICFMPIPVCCIVVSKNRSISCFHETNGLVGKTNSYTNKYTRDLW